MAYARRNKTSTTPQPAPRRRGRAVVVAGPQNPAATLSEFTPGWNFAARQWIAFDPPTSTSPAWIDISGFVEQENPIQIVHGRGDGLSDVNASTCSLTVDNSGGHFSSANPAGAWYGQIRKGAWLKVELYAPSGKVSERFVGFITSLPTKWQGEYKTGLITASDRFEKLGLAPALLSAIEHEVLSDPNIVGYGSMQGYWNLREGQGSLTFGDTSGRGARHLVAASFGGVPPGTGFAASNVAGPGFDGTRAVSFNPPNTGFAAPDTTQGTYLTAPIASPPPGTFNLSTGAYSGLYPTLEFWFQVPILISPGTGEVIAGFYDPVTSFGVTVVVTSQGKLDFRIGGTNYANDAFYAINFIGYPINVDDGAWHHVVIGFAGTDAGGGWGSIVSVLDGVWARAQVEAEPFGGVTSMNFTQLTIGGAFYGTDNPGAFVLGTVNIAEVAWYWSDLWNATPATGRPPDFLSHYYAGTTGFAGERTDQRVARIARYAGLPQPTTLVSTSFNPVPSFTPTTLGQVQRYTPATIPWLNLAPGAHQVATQSIAGRRSPDVMREAARTEGMPLFIDRSGYLALQPSTIRQNTTPAWSVDAADLDPATDVADDYAYTTNQVTVTPNGQAAQTVIGPAGLASQAKHGQRDGSQATASLNPVEAQSLGLGIIALRADPGPRAAPLAIEVATTALLPGYGPAWFDAVLASEISTPARVTNAPGELGGGTYDVLIEGWTETITAGSLLMAFNVSPVQGPTYQLDDAVLGRLDTDGTSLNVGLTSTATTFTASVATTSSAAWTTDPAEFPFDIAVDTERMTVTSIAPVSLGVDATFETGATGWTLTNSTLAQSSLAAHAGTYSGLLTASAAGNFSAATPQFAVYGSATYLLSSWFRLAAGAPNNELGLVSWYTSGGALISTVSNPFQLTPQSSWRNNASAVTAPSNAAFASVAVRVTAAAGGDAVYLDDVTFPLLTGGTQQFTVTRSVNGVVATHASGSAVSLWQPLTLAY